MNCCSSQADGGTCSKCHDSSSKTFYCTACAKRCLSLEEVREHPYLKGVGICTDCYTFLTSSPFTIDKNDGCEEQCRWCGQGGKIVVCTCCNKVFCETCIVRNYGCLHGLALILHNNSWSCFCCSPVLLGVHVKEFKNFRKSITGDVHGVNEGIDGVNEVIDSEDVATLLRFFLNQNLGEKRNNDKKSGRRGRPKSKLIQQVMKSTKSTRKKKEIAVGIEHVGCRKRGRQLTKLKGQKSGRKSGGKQKIVCTISADAQFRPHQVKLKLRGAERRRKSCPSKVIVEESKCLDSNIIVNDPILQQKGGEAKDVHSEFAKVKLEYEDSGLVHHPVHCVNCNCIITKE